MTAPPPPADGTEPVTYTPPPGPVRLPEYAEPTAYTPPTQYAPPVDYPPPPVDYPTSSAGAPTAPVPPPAAGYAPAVPPAGYAAPPPAGPGYPPPYGYPPGYAVQPPVNTYAILSVIFAFVVFAPLGIYFGTKARQQIAATGERGSELATVGIIGGWIFTGIFALILLVWCGFAVTFGVAAFTTGVSG